MKIPASIAAFAVAVAFLATPLSAHAILVDFRTASFVGGINPDHALLAEVVANGLTVRLEPRPMPDARLYWDSTDGFGVRFDYERDEIEGVESLLISFWNASGQPVLVDLKKVYLTDLFNERGYRELGWYDVDDDGTQTPFQARVDADRDSNGTKTLMPEQETQAISFGAPGRIGDQHHEFSVAAIEFEELAAVPEPASTALLALGAVMLLCARQRPN